MEDRLLDISAREFAAEIHYLPNDAIFSLGFNPDTLFIFANSSSLLVLISTQKTR